MDKAAESPRGLARTRRYRDNGNANGEHEKRETAVVARARQR